MKAYTRKAIKKQKKKQRERERGKKKKKNMVILRLEFCIELLKMAVKLVIAVVDALGTAFEQDPSAYRFMTMSAPAIARAPLPYSGYL